MPTLQSWSPIVYGSDNPVVVTNSKGLIIRRDDITSPEGSFGGSYAKAIQAAIEDLSNGEYPFIADYRFDTRATIPNQTPASCVEDKDHPYAPCGSYDASDYELSYVDVPDIEVDNLNLDPWQQSWSGTVWIHRPVELTEAILPRKNCTIDFLHNLVTMKADVPFISMGQGTDMCEFASVRNVRVLPHTLQTQAIIRLNVLPGFNALSNGVRLAHIPFGRLQYNTLENITILAGGAVDRCCDGIHIFNAGGRDANRAVWGGNYSQWNTFRNIRMASVRRGIFIEQATWNASYNNTNVFSNVVVDGFRRVVEFKVPVVCEKTQQEIRIFYQNPDDDFKGIQACHFNVFQHVVGRGARVGITDGGFVNIYGNGNRLEHVALANWSDEYGAEYSAASHKKAGAEDGLSESYLCAYTMALSETAFPNPGQFRIDAPSFDPRPAPREFTDTCSGAGGRRPDEHAHEELP